MGQCCASRAGTIPTAVPGSIHSGQINPLESINKTLLLGSSSTPLTHSQQRAGIVHTSGIIP